MVRLFQHKAWFAFSAILILGVMLAACGSSSSMATTTSFPQNSTSKSDSSSAGNAGSQNTGAVTTASTDASKRNAVSNFGPQYLIKTLNVTMQVKDTRKVASDLQSWLSTADPLSTSSGADYSQVGDQLYTISLTFSVQASSYPQVYTYLRDYSSQVGKGGRLLGFTEKVQDVSNDYVDTESRIKNYKGEQTRLLVLLDHAQAVSDIVTIDQKLSEVEGNIETNEAHLKLLTDQVTFYTVNISLQPIMPDTLPGPRVDTGWSIDHVLGSAFAASLAFAQGLLTLLIWLLAFSVYIIPLAIIAWLFKRYRRGVSAFFTPRVATATASPRPGRSPIQKVSSDSPAATVASPTDASSSQSE